MGYYDKVLFIRCQLSIVPVRATAIVTPKPISHVMRQIIVGLTGSIILLAMSSILVRLTARRPSHSPIDVISAEGTITGSGILQSLWLFGHEPHLTGVAIPELHALREAGMFEVGRRLGRGLEK